MRFTVTRADGLAGRGRDGSKTARQDDRGKRAALVGVLVTLARYKVVLRIFEAPDDEIALEIITKLQIRARRVDGDPPAFTRERPSRYPQDLMATRTRGSSGRAVSSRPVLVCLVVIISPRRATAAGGRTR